MVKIVVVKVGTWDCLISLLGYLVVVGVVWRISHRLFGIPPFWAAEI